jgi:hypothetical protein
MVKVEVDNMGKPMQFKPRELHMDILR